MEPIYYIFGISVLGPIIGSLIGVFKRPSDRFMYNMLAFASGVMLAISFMELIPESLMYTSILFTCVGILVGAIFMFLLDKTIPQIHPELSSQTSCNNLKRTATYLIVGIFLHNFPEGMAIAIGTVSNIKVSLAIALAIAVHNIPEGICTSAPYYYCTKKRLKSFLISSSTIIPIILGFLLAQFVFQRIPLSVVGFIVAITAGLMIYISCDELIPTACSRKGSFFDASSVFMVIVGVLFVIALGGL